KTLFSLEDFARFFAGKDRFNKIVNILNVQAVTRDSRAISNHSDLWQSGGGFSFGFNCPTHRGQHALYFLGLSSQRFEIVAKEFDGNVTARAGNQFINTHFNRLHESE